MRVHRHRLAALDAAPVLLLLGREAPPVCEEQPVEAPPHLQPQRGAELPVADEAAFHEEPGPYSAYGYMEASVLLDAMKRAGAAPSRDKIVTELPKTEMDSLLGHVSFDAKGELRDPFVFLYQVKADDFALVKTGP